MDLYRDSFWKKDLQVSNHVETKRAVSILAISQKSAKSKYTAKSKFTAKSHLTGRHSVEDVQLA
jgi:hypothetical protein